MPRLLPVLAATAALALTGCPGEAEKVLDLPMFVDLAPDGNLLVANIRTSRVVRLTPEGELLERYCNKGIGPGKLWRIWGLAALPDGGFVVLDHQPEDFDPDWMQLEFYDAKGMHQGNHSAVTPGQDPSQAWYEGIGVVDDTLAVGDVGGDRIIIRKLDGTVVRTLHEIQGGPPIRSPTSVKRQGDSLWIAEYKAHRVRRITLDGRQLLSVEAHGRGDGEFMFPITVDAAPDGSWFAVADLGNYRVQRFDAEGHFLGAMTPEATGPNVRPQLYNLTIGEDGRIYVVDTQGGRILVYHSDGTPLRTISG